MLKLLCYNKYMLKKRLAGFIKSFFVEKIKKRI